jgi:hypothetical protein
MEDTRGVMLGSCYHSGKRCTARRYLRLVMSLLTKSRQLSSANVCGLPGNAMRRHADLKPRPTTAEDTNPSPK